MPGCGDPALLLHLTHFLSLSPSPLNPDSDGEVLQAIAFQVLWYRGLSVRATTRIRKNSVR